MSDVLAHARAGLEGRPAWIVGGALRDRLLGHPATELDLAVEGDVEDAAHAIARGARANSFPLSEEFGAWRVTPRDRSWQIDLSPLHGEGIEQDLALRDFTVNALAEPLAGGALLDPFGGEADLRAKRLRAVAPEAFADDPLRVLRLARLACELGFDADAATVAAARERAAGLERISPERVFAELKRIVAAPAAVAGLELMDRAGATEAILPELSALRGIEQNRFHHLDVHDHTLAVLAAAIELERDPGAMVGDEHAAPVAALLAEPLSDELTRGTGLRFGALLHDIAKPATRGVTPDGRVTFIGHDEVGAGMSRAVLARMRTSERLQAHVAALTRNHLRLGFLVNPDLRDRRTVYRYLLASEPVEVDVTLLSIADRLATRGENADAGIAKHLDFAREILGHALRWRADGAPAPLVRGDDLVRELAIEPGPQLGALLAELAEAHFAGDVVTRDDAIAFARERLATAGTG